MDILSTLQECSLRGVSFPVISLKESFSHDTPQHKSVDRDGAFVENTGRNPFVFAIVAPFYAKTIARGKNESWDDLYPTRFESVRATCLDRTTADFVHPLYGTFKVKITDWDSTLNADERGGQTVSFTLIETRDDGEETAFTASTQSRARSSAVDLDSQLGTLSPPPSVFAADEPEQSFLDIIDSLRTIVDSTSLQAQQGLAKIDRAVSKLTKLSDSINRSSSVLATNPLSGTTTNLGPLSAGSGRIWTNCQVLKACLQELRFKLTANSGKTISIFVVTSPVMLPTLASRLASTVVELQALNPEMVRNRFTIPENTVIRYYKKG